MGGRPTGLPPRIGAHVSGRERGLIGTIASAREIGAEAVQAFGSNPRGWAPPRLPGPEEAAAIRSEFAAAGLPLYLHAPYPLNLASPNPEFRRRSRDLLAATAALAARVGALGVVVHAGHAGPAGMEAGRSEAAAALRAAAAAAGAGAAAGAQPDPSIGAVGIEILVELTAGGAGSVAATLPEAAALFEACGRPDALGLCLDTCHLFAAGYPLDDPRGVAETFAELRALGLDARLRLVHANDAAGTRGSHLDRHANIGLGSIGTDGFRALLAEPAVAAATVVVETPGTSEVRARDVALLRSLAVERNDEQGSGPQGSSSEPGPS